MAVFNLEDMEGVVEVVVFPETYGRTRSLLVEDAAILMTGHLEITDEQRRLLAESILPLDEAEEKLAREVVIALPEPVFDAASAERVKQLLRERPGPCPVYIEVTRPEAFRATVRASDALKVSPSRDLALALEGILGKGAVRFR